MRGDGRARVGWTIRPAPPPPPPLLPLPLRDSKVPTAEDEVPITGDDLLDGGDRFKDIDADDDDADGGSC